MKQCNKCKQEKILAEFSKDKRNKDGLQRTCKECQKQHSKQYYESNPEYFKEAFNQTYLNNKSLHTTVYLLPDHNYVGITNNLYYRMIVHRNDYKRNTDNWIEIARYSNREDALKHEALLHSQGYAGAK